MASAASESSARKRAVAGKECRACTDFKSWTKAKLQANFHEVGRHLDAATEEFVLAYTRHEPGYLLHSALAAAMAGHVLKPYRRVAAQCRHPAQISPFIRLADVVTGLATAGAAIGAVVIYRAV